METTLNKTSTGIGLRQVASVTAVAWTAAFLDWVDFYTYAILAPIIAPIFFPHIDPIASLLAAFGALAVGFLFRPLGALLFGHIGDRFGRKVAFLTALTMMMIGTVGIGLLPSYAVAGLFASVGVFLLRIIQGLALGGGYGAAIVYLGEFVPEHRRGMFTGFLFTTPAAGIGVASTLQVIFSSYLGLAAFKEWGWRLNFIIVGAIVFIVVLIMFLFYKETPVFSMLRSVRRVTSSPLREVFSRKYIVLVLLAWIGVIGAHGPIWYTNQLFNSYYLQYKGVPISTANFILSTSTYLALWMYILFGWLSDKIGRKPILLLGIYGNALYFILAFWLYEQFVSPFNFTAIFLITLSMTLFNGIGYSGAMSAWLLELFPARIRTSAVAFAYNLGYGITGGLTPFMITWIFSMTRDLYLSTLLWATLVPMVMCSWFLIKGPETLGTRIWAELSAAKFAKKPIVVPPTVSIRETISKIAEQGARVAFVIGEKFIGVFGARALARAIAAGASLDKPVAEYAIKVACVREDAPLTEVFVTMEKYKVRSVPVCSGKFEIVGYIEARELLNEALGLRSILRKKVALRFKAKDAIARELIYIKQGTPLKEVVKLMAEHDIGFVPIIEDGKLAGVFSEKDLIDVIAKNVSLDTPVDKIAKKDAIMIDSNATLKDAAELMVKHNIRHLPIVENGKVVGVISVRDLLKVIG
jgi:CBS domain-containing protein/nitrate/nitrite transporter NarK